MRKGNRAILVSAPHGVPQVRLGKRKYEEIGSLSTALFVAEQTDCYLIAKTKNEFDDVNFDDKSEYKDECYKLIQSCGIKYVIDFHGLSHDRGIDINFGTHIGKNIENDRKLFEEFKAKFEKDFVVSVDNPFMGGIRTISGSCKKRFPHLWTLQIEIDWHLTNKRENEERYKKLVEILIDFINNNFVCD